MSITVWSVRATPHAEHAKAVIATSRTLSANSPVPCLSVIPAPTPAHARPASPTTNWSTVSASEPAGKALFLVAGHARDAQPLSPNADSATWSRPLFSAWPAARDTMSTTDNVRRAAESVTADSARTPPHALVVKGGTRSTRGPATQGPTVWSTTVASARPTTTASVSAASRAFISRPQALPARPLSALVGKSSSTEPAHVPPGPMR